MPFWKKLISKKTSHSEWNKFINKSFSRNILITTIYNLNNQSNIKRKLRMPSLGCWLERWVYILKFSEIKKKLSLHLKVQNVSMKLYRYWSKSLHDTNTHEILNIFYKSNLIKYLRDRASTYDPILTISQDTLLLQLVCCEYGPWAVFTILYFVRNLQIGPIS